MNRDVEKWLEQNPPRVELTELEKNFDFDPNNSEKYLVYFDEVDGVHNIYRIRPYTPEERNSLSWDKKYEHDSSYDDLCYVYNEFGFNVLGYSVGELNELNRKMVFFISI